MGKLKILQIIPSFGIGGAEKVVLDYLTYFDKDKVEVKAISMYEDKNSIYDNFIKNNCLDVIYLNKKPGLDLSMVLKIRKVINEFKPDIIHSHMYTMKYFFYSVLSNKQVKMFHTIHNEPEKDAKGIDKFFNKIAFKLFNCIPVALTNELAIKVNKYYNISSSIVVNNGIDLEKFKNVKESKEEIRNKLGLPLDSLVIGHVGRFFKQKNHRFIIDIYKQFFETERNSCLVLVGEGELKNEIEQKVEELGLEDNVRFLGLRKDIPEILKSIDVFLFPSLYEGFPITLIEAQSTGVRCVISDQIDRKVILSENTVSVSLDDTVEKWCKMIKDTCINSNVIDSVDNYDIKLIVKKLEGIYRESIMD